MADSLPDSIDASALEQYDKLALRITRDSFADIVALHDALFSGDVAKNYQKAGLAPVRFGTAFHATMESFASEQGNFTGDIDSMLVASAWQVNLSVQLDAQKAAATVAAAAAATTMQMDDVDANADAAAAAVTPANAVEDNRAKTKAACIHRILTDPSLDSDTKQQQIAAIYDCWGTQPPTVSSFKSSSRSSPPDSFHGHAKDHGQPAQSWLYSVELYFQAEYTPNPVAKAVTYLHGEARRWWQQIGSKTLSSTASFEMFSQAFLARFVKPSDSAKARAEIPHLKQADSVESFASHFRSVNSRISVGSFIDTTTLASYFVHGLKSKLASALAAHCSLATMQELDSVISAAEEMEAKLNLAAKQDQPSLAAIRTTASEKVR